MVNLKGLFRGKLSKKDKMIIAGFIIAGILIAAGVGVYTMTMRKPAAPGQTNQVTLQASPYFSAKSQTFPTDKTINAKILDKSGAVVRSLTLTSPGWTAEAKDLSLQDYFYVTSSTNNWYFNVGKFNVSTLGGSRVAKVDANAKSKTLGLEYIKVGTWTPTYGENQTGLAGEGNTSVTFAQKFNFTEFAGAQHLQFKLKVNNSSALDVDQLNFNGETYAIDEDMKNVDNGNYTVTVNITSKYEYFTNSDSDVKNYLLTLSATTNVNATQAVSFDSWARFADEAGDTVTSPSAESILS